MSAIERSPENLRKIASGKHYPPSMVRRVLSDTADDLEIALDTLVEQSRLLDNLAITIAAIVVCADGEVEVPASVLQGIEAFELEKAPGADGAIIYRTRLAGAQG